MTAVFQEQVFARNVKVALFEETSLALLEDALQEWLDARDQEALLAVSFESEQAVSSFRCHVLYTEG